MTALWWAKPAFSCSCSAADPPRRRPHSWRGRIPCRPTRPASLLAFPRRPRRRICDGSRCLRAANRPSSTCAFLSTASTATSWPLAPAFFVFSLVSCVVSRRWPSFLAVAVCDGACHVDGALLSTSSSRVAVEPRRHARRRGPYAIDATVDSTRIQAVTATTRRASGAAPPQAVSSAIHERCYNQ